MTDRRTATESVSTHVDTDGEPTLLSRDEARHLTDAIRLTASALHELVHQAYVGMAHLALGYRRWADYVASEFDGMSRARSYQLLNQHEVVQVLSGAAGTDVAEVVTEKAARDIKPILEPIAAEVMARSEGVTDREQVLRLVSEVLDAARRSDSAPLSGRMTELHASQAKGTSGDLWYTPRTAVAPLMTILPRPPLRIWAHADVRGRSHIVDVLEESGYEVICSDLSTGQDFFQFTRADVEAMNVDVAVTNPPYSVRRRWLAHLVELGIPFALLTPETGVGEWAFESLRAAGAEAGLLLLNRRIAYSQRWGQKPVGSPPFNSGWICRGLLPPGQQLVFGEVPASY